MSDKPEITLEKGWIKRQLDLAEPAVREWPAWVQRELGLDVRPQEASSSGADRVARTEPREE